MPFPWKKVKNTKISQLVTDHLDSQRRLGGAHLVVETGFPTSLVDIFVRNRQRLKKSAKMRKNERDSLILRSPPPTPLSSPPPELSPSPQDSSPPLISTLLGDKVEETVGEAIKEVKKEDENFKGILLAVLRMSFVVVLALGTKKFALGLTMSAFFLFFVEYVGIYVYRLFIPCSEAKKRWKMTVLKFLRIGKEKGGEEKGFKVSLDQRSVDPVGYVEIFLPGRSSVPFLEDIQRQEQKSDEFRCDKKLNLEGSDSDWIVLEKKEECSSEVKKRKSRRAKMKTKMKHIFSRKSRKAKKEGNLEGVMGPVEGEIVMTFEEKDMKSISDLASVSSISCDGEEESSMNSSSGVLLEEVEDVGGVVVIREEEEIQNKENSGYLVLCLIVLIGLFGGKIFALVSILLWSFLKKSGGKFIRCFTLPVNRFLNPTA